MDHRLLVVFMSLWSSVAPDGDDVRLVGGASRCAGVLEKKHEEAWEPVEDPLSAWNLTSAAAVCRKLDCGSVLSLQRRVTSVTTPDFSNDGFMRILELASSGSTGVEISCSDSVRLLDGTSLCSGRLEVKSAQSDQRWSSVCEADFDQQDAEVVCRELGCGAPSVLQGALYGEVEAPTWTKEFQCGGNESALLDCRSSGSTRNTCSPGKAVGLTCSVFDIRLVGGVSRCGGLLEVNKQDRWKRVDYRHWNLRLAGVVCGQLDCGSAVSARRRRTSSDRYIWKTKGECEESELTKCLSEDIISSDVIEITCSDSVRLLDGTSLCSGRLEVKSAQSDQRWSSVCEADFDQQDAEVVCRELGCGAPSVLQGALYGEVEAPTWTKEFQCGGHESALLDCRSSGSTKNTCSPGNAVGLTCSDPDDVRLVGGANRCTGRLELKHGEVWKAVDHTDSHWHLKAAPVICQRLDCGSFISAGKKRESSSRPVWWIDSRCVQSGSTLHKCVMTNHELSEHSLEITCSDSVRLVNGSSLCSGRLEMKSEQSWTLVCEDEFDLEDAEEVCREFGCGAPLVLQGAPVWTRCEGLRDCGMSSSTTNTCSDGKAVELTCSAPGNIRLVGEASRCGGALEMRNHGEWRPVADWDDEWDETSAAAVCRLMDCGSALSTQITEASDDRPIWWISPSCVQSSPALSKCLLLINIDETYLGLHVICSDLLVQPNISSTSTEGVSNDNQQGLQVLLGSDFTITCSIQPQYPGGSFQLIFTTSATLQNYTQPAVNHSASFLFSAASHAHRGEYRCVYHVYVFSHNFSSESRTLGVTVSAYLTELIIRLVVLLTLLVTLLVTVLCVHLKVSRIQKPR